MRGAQRTATGASARTCARCGAGARRRAAASGATARYGNVQGLNLGGTVLIIQAPKKVRAHSLPCVCRVCLYVLPVIADQRSSISECNYSQFDSSLPKVSFKTLSVWARFNLVSRLPG